MGAFLLFYENLSFCFVCGGSECKIDCFERYEANKRGRYGGECRQNDSLRD